MAHGTHTYSVRIEWTGNQGVGTRSYREYGRQHTISARTKADIAGSSDAAFRGNAECWNPEDLMVASASACHQLWYLHLCAVNKVVVLEYRDAATGTMQENEDGSGMFERVELKPAVTISAESDRAKALALHADAHHYCFIANSVNFPVECSPTIKSGG